VLPAGLGFVGVTPPANWTCPTTPAPGASGTITCTRTGTWAAGGPPATFSVVATAGAPSTVTNTATVSGTSVDNDASDNTSSVVTRVVKATPSITTQASAGGTVGAVTATDTATVSGFNPSGTVTFRLFSDSSCTNQVFTSVVPVTGGTATSESFAPQVAGTYYWTAAYGGDTSNNPVLSGCGAPNESVTVAKASPTITTAASAGNLLGAPVRDIATLGGGFNPTGNVTFRLYSDASCTAEIFTSTAVLSAGTATSAWFTPSATGTHQWVATYPGDANNNAARGACGDPGEAVTIAPFAPPTFTRIITGDVLGPVTVGSAESVLVTDARVVGPIDVGPGGALTVVSSKIQRGVVASQPRFLSICGTEISGPPPAQALGVSGTDVPIRIGDPANGCAPNRFAGHVNLTDILATTFARNIVSGSATFADSGPGNTVLLA
jgi:hypothetical protein